ncbi:MAG: electron transfer flavoprotein subunit alpha/FixB family protein [Anaerolineales bacterium]|nr:electron transfer flavoprotein subunit alpha/FixB family protein [Anaerolineales bacterium]
MSEQTELPIWTLAEATGERINPVSFEVIARAVQLKHKLKGANVVAVLIGGPLPRAEVQRLIHHGADGVLHVADARLARFLVDSYARVLVALARAHTPTIFLAGATTYGRTLMPYVAAKLGAGLTADCTLLDIEEETGLLLQTRPAIGGNILATIKTEQARPQMATVRPHSTEILPADPGRAGEITEIVLDPDALVSRITFVGEEENAQGEFSLAEAEKIVSGGRGLGKAEHFALIQDLADALGAAVGASREAVDRGWISYPHQVGLSGKTVTPDLYMALGVSGAIQHLAGMQTAKHIIAINNDPEAQIFSVADLGIVGNLHELVPPLIEGIRARKRGAA